MGIWVLEELCGVVSYEYEVMYIFGLEYMMSWAKDKS